MSNGLKTKAPCGHDGEAVIGAYVRCLQGCKKDPYVQPQAPAKRRRGEAGHVDFCACKPCTLRRRGVKIVLRTKSGKTAEVAWDGVSNTVRWTSDCKDRLRHWKIVDDDGDVLADGMCDVETSPGDPMRIDIETLMDPAKLVVKRDGWVSYKLKPLADAFESDYAQHLDKLQREIAGAYALPAGVFSDPRQSSMKDNFGYPSKEAKEDGWYSAITGVGKPQGYKGLRQAAKAANFGTPACTPSRWMEDYRVGYSQIPRSTKADDDYWHYRYAGGAPARGTWNDIRRATLTCEGVQQCQVLSLIHGQVDVIITETDAKDQGEEAAIQGRVSARMRDVVPAGIAVEVHLQTPMKILNEVAGAVHRDLNSRWVKVDDDYCETLERTLLAATKHLRKVTAKVSRDCYGSGIEIRVRYVDSLDCARYVVSRIRY